MEAKDKKRKVLQAIFSSVFGFQLPLNVPTNTHAQRNKKVSEPVRETLSVIRVSKQKDTCRKVLARKYCQHSAGKPWLYSYNCNNYMARI